MSTRGEWLYSCCRACRSRKGRRRHPRRHHRHPHRFHQPRRCTAGYAWAIVSGRPGFVQTRSRSVIDWEMEGDIADVAFYRQLFTNGDLLRDGPVAAIASIEAAENDPFHLKEVVDEIREDPNPQLAGQKAAQRAQEGCGRRPPRLACASQPVPPDPSSSTVPLSGAA